jgi:hypothetical protein
VIPVIPAHHAGGPESATIAEAGHSHRIPDPPSVTPITARANALAGTRAYTGSPVCPNTAKVSPSASIHAWSD